MSDTWFESLLACVPKEGRRGKAALTILYVLP